MSKRKGIDHDLKITGIDHDLKITGIDHDLKITGIDQDGAVGILLSMRGKFIMSKCMSFLCHKVQ
jgi:hypothetical protein